jgi:tRNA1Val (adenine37-N6)-methyltransferase
MHTVDSITHHRSSFPRGLVQPEQGFRFSVDALLLASFAVVPDQGQILDLGAGCGVVGLGLLLRHPAAEVHILGVDISPEMTAAARANALNLGFDHKLTPVVGDVRPIGATLGFQPGAYHLVLCNPPYREKNQGRLPMNEAKRAAKFATSAGIGEFISAAAMALTTRGRLCMIHLPEQVSRLVRAMHNCNMEPKRLRFVHSLQSKPASLVLIEARKAARPGLCVDPPLVLYRSRQTGDEQANNMSDEALLFCPFLHCNSSRAATKPTPGAEGMDQQKLSVHAPLPHPQKPITAAEP